MLTQRHRTRLLAGAVFTTLMLGAPAALADRWAAPYPSIHASAGNRYAMKVVPADDLSARGEVVSLTKTGEETSHWKRPLVIMPVDVFVGDHAPVVVTLDQWHNVGYKHVLVVYGKDGKVLADYTLEDLLTPEEIEAHTGRSVSSRWWRPNATTRFDVTRRADGTLGSVFTLNLEWGKVIRVDMETGKLVPKATSP